MSLLAIAAGALCFYQAERKPRARRVERFAPYFSAEQWTTVGPHVRAVLEGCR